MKTKTEHETGVSKPKIALVVQRYGQDLTGGSEFLCRMIAERLARWYTVHVLTTCAKDYVTWENVYTPGKGHLHKVTVYRFPVEKKRDIKKFNEFSDWLFNNDHTLNDELRWLEEQGPYVPSLIEHIRSHTHEYDVFIYFTYLYYPTYYGILRTADKSILVPTAHREPPLFLSIYREIFCRPKGMIFNTRAEQRLVLKHFDRQNKYNVIAGIGLTPPRHIDGKSFPRSQGFDRPYIVFGGRLDEGKNVHELIEFYRTFKKRKGMRCYLVLMGSLAMDLPADPDIIYIGRVSEQKKWEVLKGALATVIPSHLESLSILALESLLVRTPILVNERCDVLKDLCLESHGGLYYSSYNEFELMLEYFLDHPIERKIIGRQGYVFVRKHYRWPRIIQIYRELIDTILKGSRGRSSRAF